jgi:hypothetical protein
MGTLGRESFTLSLSLERRRRRVIDNQQVTEEEEVTHSEEAYPTSGKSDGGSNDRSSTTSPNSQFASGCRPFSLTNVSVFGFISAWT